MQLKAAIQPDKLKDDTAGHKISVLSHAARCATMICHSAAAKPPTVTQLSQLIALCKMIQPTSDILKKKLWMCLTKTLPKHQQYFKLAMQQLISIPDQLEPVTSVVHQLACYIELFHDNHIGPWLEQQLETLLIAYAYIGSHTSTLTLPWLAHMQAMEDILGSCLGTTIHAGYALNDWIDRLIAARQNENWHSYQFLSAQLYQYSGKKIVSRWIKKELSDFDQTTEKRFGNHSKTTALGIWFRQLNTHMEARPIETDNQTTLLPASDQSIIASNTSDDLPLSHIVHARHRMFSLNKHLQAHWNNQSNTIRHVATQLQAIAMRLATQRLHYPLHHMRLLFDLSNTLGQLCHQHDPTSCNIHIGNEHDHINRPSASTSQQHR